MMRRDEPAVIMTRAEHIVHIERHWSHERQQRADKAALDVLFEEQLRRVAEALAEPEPPKMNLPKPGAWLLAALFWFGITGTFYMVFR